MAGHFSSWRNISPEQLGEIMNRRDWTDAEIQRLTNYYSKTPPSLFNISDLAAEMKRSESSIHIKASRLGISGRREDSCTPSDLALENRRKSKTPLSQEARAEIADKVKAHHAEFGHPKGMLGKHHSPESKAAISAGNMGKKSTPDQVIKAMKTKMERFGTLVSTRPCTWKQGWRDIEGRRIYARSRWEANYARYLQFLKMNGHIAEWEHEPVTFWFESVKRGVRSYLPDFRVTTNNGLEEYHEVKGWMDPRSKTKLKRMKKYHPLVRITLIESAWFRSNASKLSGIIKEWEQQ